MLSTFTRGVARRLRALAGDRRGMVLQETAFVMPVLITMMLGGYDVARYALLQQKLSRVVMATGDMVAQGATISTNEVDIIFSATSTMIRPFQSSADQIVIVSSVSTVGANPTKVDWQRSGGGTLTGSASKIGVAGQNATLPGGFTVSSGGNAIIAEVYYNFEPVFVPDLVASRVLYHRAVFRPRQSSLSTLCDPTC